MSAKDKTLMINMSLRYILNLTVVVPNKHSLGKIALRIDTKELSFLVVQHTQTSHNSHLHLR